MLDSVSPMQSCTYTPARTQIHKTKIQNTHHALSGRHVTSKTTLGVFRRFSQFRKYGNLYS